MHKFYTKYFFISCGSFVLLALYFLLSQYVISGDTYFHLSVGREVMQTGHIPQKDNFVYGSLNPTYVSSEWLSGVIFSVLVTQFGMVALLGLRVICGLFTIYFTFKTLRLVTNNYLISNIFTLVVGYLLPFRLNGGRPEMFSLVFLALVNYVCLRFFIKRTNSPFLYILPLIFFLWPNLHGFSIFGLMLVATFCLISFFQKDTDSNKSAYTNFRIISIISVLLAFINYQRVFEFMQANTFNQYLIEWVSLWQRVEPTGTFARYFNGITIDIYLFLVFFIGYVLLLLATMRRNISNMTLLSILYLIFLLLPFKAYRLITPILILVVPYMLFLITNSTKKILNTSLYWKGVYVLFLGIIGFSAITGHQLGGEKLAMLYPANAISLMKENLTQQRIFTIYGWKEYILWTIPDVKIFSDVLTQYRTLDDFKDEQKLHSSKISSDELKKIIDKYTITIVINTQPDAARIMGTSITPVYKLDEWKLIYLDNLSAVYAKTDTIKYLPVDLSSIHPELDTRLKYHLADEKKAIDQLKNLLQFDLGNEFARTQLLYYYLTRIKDLKKAEVLAQESRQIAPANPLFSYTLALLSLTQQDCVNTRIYAQEALEKNKFNTELEDAITQTLNACK